MKYLIVLLTLLSTYSAIAQNAMERLENDFTSQNLDSKTLVAFEQRAVEKVIEFAQYFELISNSEYDLKFRQHSTQLANKLFTDSLCKIKSLLDEKNYPANDFFEFIKDSEHFKIVCTASDITIIENLFLDTDSNYRGKLVFTQNIDYFSQEKKIRKSTSVKRIATFFLMRTKKKFGAIEKEIWELTLCDIKDY